MALRTVGKGSARRAVTYKQLEQIGVDPRGAIDNPDEVLRKLGMTDSNPSSNLPQISRVFDDVPMLPLQGSEKQVAWAEKIRGGLVSKRAIQEAENRYRDMKNSGNDTEFERNLLSLRYKVENTLNHEAAKMTSAKDIIERRNDSMRETILKRHLKEMDSEFLRKTFPKPSDFLRWAA